MFEKLGDFFNRMKKPEIKELTSKDAAKERLHLVLMQDRANVSVDFLELMKQEIIDVIKKYIVIDESAIDVRLTSQENEDGTNGAPALYANIPIINIKNDAKAEKINDGTLTYKHGELEKADKVEEKSSENTLNQESVAEVSETQPTGATMQQTTEETTQQMAEEPTQPVVEQETTTGNTEPTIVIELAEAENKNIQDETPNEDVEGFAQDETENKTEAEDASDIMEVVEESKEEPAQEKNETAEKAIEEEPAVIENKAETKTEVSNEQEIETDSVEPVLDFAEDEEDDDDDVTFDDLLKKAEEEAETEKVQATKKKKTVKQKKR